MKNTCPECGTAYNVANAPVGRKFTCKKCNTPVVVTEEGLDYQNPPAKAAAPAPAAPAPAGGAFEFDDAAEDEDRKPAKVARAKSKRPRDEDEDAPADEDEAPRKPKKKPARARDEDEPADDEDDRPARRGRAKARGSEGGFVTDLIGLTGPTTPAFVKLLFFAFAGAVLLSALFNLISLATSDRVPTEFVIRALGSELLTVAAALFVGRVLAELAVVGFAVLNRFNELKAELEKANATLANPPVAAAPPQPAPTAPVAPATPVMSTPAVPFTPPADGPLQ